MPEYLMDRIFERLSKLNDRWVALVSRIPEMDPKQAAAETEALRCDFANIITLAQDRAWRLLAESEGLEIPEDEETDEPAG